MPKYQPDKYKPGDKVVVRPDLNLEDVYRMKGNENQTNVAVDEMLEFAGKTVTIRGVHAQYTIVGCCWNWTDEMFLGLESDIYGDEDIEVPDFEELFL